MNFELRFVGKDSRETNVHFNDLNKVFNCSVEACSCAHIKFTHKAVSV